MTWRMGRTGGSIPGTGTIGTTAGRLAWSRYPPTWQSRLLLPKTWLALEAWYGRELGWPTMTKQLFSTSQILESQPEDTT
jgi:hypothetical protein